MPLSTDAASAAEEERRKGLVGGPGSLPGIPGASPAAGGGGIDFQGLFPSIDRSPIINPGAARDTSGLQFDPDFASLNVGLQRQEADLGLARQSNITGVDQGYQREVQASTKMQEMARKKLLERMSGQGILSSGITGQKGSELNQAHQTYLDDLGYQRSAQLAGVEGDYVQRMNQIAGQREGLYGQQQQTQQMRQIEAARQAAEQQAQQQAAEQNRQAMAQQAQAYAQQQQAQQAMLQQIMAQQYSAPSVSSPQYAQPAAPQQQGGIWSQQDIERTRNQANAAGKGSKSGAYNYLDQMQINDPNWAAWAANTAKHYGAQNATEFLYNPYAYGLPSGAVPGVM